MIVDLSRAEAFLASRFNSDISDIAPLGSGAWSRAFEFRWEGSDYVIRFGAHLEDFCKDRLAARYASPALPIPGVVEIGEAFGEYYAISERMFGRYIDKVDGPQMLALLPALFAALDAARLVDLAGTTGYGGWGSDGNAPYVSWQAVLLDVANEQPTARTHGALDRLKASPTGIEPFQEAYAHLQELVHYVPEERNLIHSDLLNYNVLVEGDRITGVLDWGCAKYGDFLYDLAWLCFWQPRYPSWRNVDFWAEAQRHYASIGLEIPHFEERLRCCQIHIGLEGQLYQAYISDWDNLRDTARHTLAVATGQARSS